MKVTIIFNITSLSNLNRFLLKFMSFFTNQGLHTQQSFVPRMS